MAILETLLDAAKAAGLRQKEIAEICGVSAEALSRMKKRGSATSDLLETLARHLGLKISLTGGTCPHPAPLALRSSDKTDFRGKYATELAWSTQTPSDELLIQKALLNPQILMLIDAALEFGLHRLQKIWADLKADGNSGAVRIAHITNRILEHINDGIEIAAACNSGTLEKTVA